MGSRLGKTWCGQALQTPEGCGGGKVEFAAGVKRISGGWRFGGGVWLLIGYVS